MTRYVMNISQSVDLLLHAGNLVGGEVVVKRMPAIKLMDLAHVFIERFERLHHIEKGSTKWDVVGARPGETVSEMIYTAEEATRTVTDGKCYYLLPAMKFGSRDYSRYRDALKVAPKALDSHDEVPLDRDALRDLLGVWGI
jgi:FlaA1/EpsC-like NDP-sugar epimerase